MDKASKIARKSLVLSMDRIIQGVMQDTMKQWQYGSIKHYNKKKQGKIPNVIKIST